MTVGRDRSLIPTWLQSPNLRAFNHPSDGQSRCGRRTGQFSGSNNMKLSVVILCWNDSRVISDCLRSILNGTRLTEFEVIVSDNGSSDGSPQLIRETYPQVRVIENGENLRFARGNNVGIQASQGEYILILNPDTVIHEGALDKLVLFADQHQEAGAFACRVLNPDGSYQHTVWPFPSIRGEWISALCPGRLHHLLDWVVSDTHAGWKGDTQHLIDWQAGCFIMFRGDLLKRLGGFDEQFFYYYEDVDLCHRVWDAGYSIIYTPAVTITHLGGQSTRRFPLAFELDKYVTRYRYFYKYYGRRGARSCRRISLVSLRIRWVAYELLQLVKPTAARKERMNLNRAAIEWNKRIDPVRLVEHGEEPDCRVRAAARISTSAAHGHSDCEHQ